VIGGSHRLPPFNTLDAEQDLAVHLISGKCFRVKRVGDMLWLFTR
jgi:hypothetical protein